MLNNITSDSNIPRIVQKSLGTQVNHMYGEIPNKIFRDPEAYMKSLKSEGKECVNFVQKESKTIYPNGTPKTINATLVQSTAQFKVTKLEDDEDSTKYLVPLNQLDKDILDICMTQQQNGHEYVTLACIYHMLGGKRNQPEADLRQAIIESVDKMIHIDVRLNAHHAYQKLNRLCDPNGKPKRESKQKSGNIIFITSLLPAKFITAYVNGHLDDRVIQLEGMSAIYRYASDLKEIMWVPLKWLTIPKLKNTPSIVQMKNELATHIAAIKRSITGGGKGMYPIIDINKVLDLVDSSEFITAKSKFHKRLRPIIDKCLMYWVHIGVLNDFHYLDKDNNECDSIQDKDCSKVKIDLV